jgi:hypothetical protein
MTGNVLTIVVGLIGVGASLVFSLVFYQAGKKTSAADRAMLLETIEGQRDILLGLRITQPVITQHEVQQALDSAGAGDGSAADVIASSLNTAASTAALDRLVRASLGALLNERGEVELARLLQDVDHAVGNSHVAEVLEVLRHMRAQGTITWQGSADNLTATDLVRVSPRSHGLGS